MLLFLEQCRKAPLENAPHSDVTVYARNAATVTSSGVDDVVYDAADDDEDDRRVADTGMEHSGNGELASRNWPPRRMSVAASADGDTRQRVARPTPVQLLTIQRFRHAGDVDVAVTTRRTAAASSSTSFRLSMTSLVTSFLLVQLTLTILRTRSHASSEYQQ